MKLEQAVLKEECAVPVVKADSPAPGPKAAPSTAELPCTLSQNPTPFPDLLRPSAKECMVRFLGVYGPTCLRSLVTNLHIHLQSCMPSRAGAACRRHEMHWRRSTASRKSRATYSTQ